MDFQYKVTVIVPVYNVEEYLRSCLDSLVAQTIDHRLMEVLLINDGSTDNSLEICQEYAEQYGMFKVFSKENEGVSATRNFGIRNAKGKYIMYLDSDDTVTNNTVKGVTDFFDTVYDKVDMVTYVIRRYNEDGTTRPLHFRYNYLKKTGIYDLEKNIYACQVLMNIFVKNQMDKNVLFDEEIGYHEDQIYCNEVLSTKRRLGFVSGCEYKYNLHSTSMTGSNTNALSLFETTTSYWESIFDMYDNVPKYFQALFFHDISWKLSDSTLWPFHYNEEDLRQAHNRITAMLDRVDNQVIMNYPRIDNYQKLYWIRMKSNDNTCPIIEQESMSLYSACSRLYARKDIEIILKRIYVNNHKVKIVGYFKSPFFSYISNVKLYAKKNEEMIELEKREASSSYYKAKEKTEIFWQLVYETNITKYTELDFLVDIDNIMIPTVYYNCDTTAFYKGFTDSYTVDSVSIRQTKHGFIFSLAEDSEDINRSIAKNSEKANEFFRNLRNEYLLQPRKRVWLYYDNNTVEKDNGYYQFLHDVSKNDGVERYYILSNFSYEVSKLFPEELLHNVITFGTPEHQTLYLMAEKILTAFIEPESLIPFNLSEHYQINDIFNAEIIYLQHGVLHAHLRWYYTPIGVAVDKVVVSTQFEIDNFSTNYGFKKNDLIPTGMPRYEYIDRKADNPKKRILFAPSWRSYLVGEIVQKNGIRIGSDSKVVRSNYYINIMSFLNNQKLNDFLEEKNIDLDIKLHPNFLQLYRHLLNIKSEKVHIAPSNVDLTRYSLFITDFSSYTFDYAYLSRSIMYFVPDYLEFKSGMNRYRELDLPFEKSFGNLSTDSELAVDEVIRIVENDFVPDPVFKERMDNFYLPLDNCTDKLYQYLMCDPEDIEG